MPTAADSPPSGLLAAAAVLSVLALLCLAGVLSERVRRPWQWGRSGKAAPVSRPGCALAFLAFAGMGGALAAASRGLLSGAAAFLVSLAGFALFLAAGLLDTWRAGPPPSEGEGA